MSLGESLRFRRGSVVFRLDFDVVVEGRTLRLCEGALLHDVVLASAVETETIVSPVLFLLRRERTAEFSLEPRRVWPRFSKVRRSDGRGLDSLRVVCDRSNTGCPSGAWFDDVFRLAFSFLFALVQTIIERDDEPHKITKANEVRPGTCDLIFEVGLEPVDRAVYDHVAVYPLEYGDVSLKLGEVRRSTGSLAQRFELLSCRAGFVWVAVIKLKTSYKLVEVKEE